MNTILQSAPTPSVHREYGLDLVAITALWVSMIALATPFGDFPVNDDWVYALGVKSLLEKGYFSIPSWSSANVGPQIFWGALFCLPFGFSFDALRASTLVLGLAGVWALYALIREETGDRRTALLGSLSLAVNPVYFGCANSFMTDVPFFSLEIIAAYFLLRALRRYDRPALAIGIMIAFLAILVRQFGILLLVAFGVGYIIRRGWSITNVSKVAVLVLAGFCLHVVYQGWLIRTGRTTTAGHQVTALLHHVSPLPVIRAAIVTFLYVGLYALPFIAALLPSFRQAAGARRGRHAVATFLFGATLFGVLVWMERTMPSTGNMIIKSGLGPLTLRDTFILEINLPTIPPFVEATWLIVTLVAVAAGCAAVWYVAFAARNAFRQPVDAVAHTRPWLFGMTASFMGIYLVLVLVISTAYQVFDRYLLLFLPFLLLLISSLKPEARTVRLAGVRLSVAVLVLYGAFSVVATRDYFEWNRARWQATTDLMREGRAAPDRIDGGYEFNGWFSYDPAYLPTDGKSWWWVHDDEYMIASGPVTGYTEVSRYSYRRWFMPTDSSVVVLRRSRPGDTQ